MLLDEWLDDDSPEEVAYTYKKCHPEALEGSKDGK